MDGASSHTDFFRSTRQAFQARGRDSPPHACRRVKSVGGRRELGCDARQVALDGRHSFGEDMEVQRRHPRFSSTARRLPVRMGSTSSQKRMASRRNRSCSPRAFSSTALRRRAGRTAPLECRGGRRRTPASLSLRSGTLESPRRRASARRPHAISRSGRWRGRSRQEATSAIRGVKVLLQFSSREIRPDLVPIRAVFSPLGHPRCDL